MYKIPCKIYKNISKVKNKTKNLITNLSQSEIMSIKGIDCFLQILKIQNNF